MYENLPPFADFSRRTALGIASAGVAMALIAVVLGLILNAFIISPALCRGLGQAACQDSLAISFHVASVIGAIAAVALLVNASVYRPLLVVLAAVAGTWPLYSQSLPFINLPWYWQIVILALVNGVALGAFSWVLRLYNFAIALAVTIITVVAMVVVISL